MAGHRPVRPQRQGAVPLPPLAAALLLDATCNPAVVEFLTRSDAIH